MLRQSNHGSLQLICSTSCRIVHRPWEVRQLFNRREGLFIQDYGLVVIQDKNTRWKDEKEWVEVEWGGALQKRQINQDSSSGPG